MGVRQYCFQEQLVYGPDNPPIHQTKIKYTCTLPIYELHWDVENTLSQSSIFAEPNKDTQVNKI